MDDLDKYEYHLPPALIAEKPLAERDHSRLLVLDRSLGTFEHTVFTKLPLKFRAGDVIVINDTQVIPAKISARRASGGFVRLLLLRQEPNQPGVWQAMASPIKRLKPGQVLSVTTPAGRVHQLRVVDIFIAEDGFRRLHVDLGGGDNVYKLLNEIGSAPLPPYIRRAPESGEGDLEDEQDVQSSKENQVLSEQKNYQDEGEFGEGNLAGNCNADEFSLAKFENVPATDENLREYDLERYQTVFARTPGAVAAPTAGLHFTQSLLDQLQAMGVEVCRVTLHVGPGTFKSIEKSVDEHFIEPEIFFIDRQTAQRVTRAKQEGRRVIAVGTTSLRALESAATTDGGIREVDGEATNLYVKPGYQFQVVDALITNFHLSRSSLLVLVAAFAGRELILEAYKEAVERHYRFYSYGDAMFIS